MTHEPVRRMQRPGIQNLTLTLAVPALVGARSNLP